MGIRSNGDVSSEAEGLGKRLMENGVVGPVKYKRRKVSAVRDFPPGCGPNADVESNGNGSVEKSKVKEKDSVVVESRSVKELESLVGVKDSDETTMPLVDSNQAKMAVDTLPDSVVLDKSVEVDVADSLVENIQKSFTPRRRMFPPRRRVSAVRDYPPGCGMDVAPVKMKEFQTSVDSAKDKKTADELNGRIKEKKIIGDRAEVKSGGGAVKKILVQRVHANEDSGIKLKQQHMEKTSIKPPHESDSSQSDSSISKKVDRGSGSSGVKVGMESVKLSKDMSFKRKFPGKSMNESRAINQSQGTRSVGLDSSDDRVIVQSLMAEPNCPWQGKKNINPASGIQSQVEQGKRTLTSASGIQSQVEQGKKTIKSASGNQSEGVEYGGLELSGDREIVQSLMASPNCPWGSGKKPFKSPSGPAKRKSMYVR